MTGELGKLSHSSLEGNDSDILARRLDQSLTSSVDQFAREMPISKLSPKLERKE